MEQFYLEEPSIDRKEEALDYINEHLKYNSNINGSGGLHRYIDKYEGWLEKLEQDNKYKPGDELVPAKTYFLVRVNDNKIIGMTNIRLYLNDALKKSGGHIGYGIRPTERRKGYNKINLYLALTKCREYGLKEVLLDCEKDNLGSSKTMVSLGGELVEEYYEEGNHKCICQKYKIDVDKSLKKYKDIYEPIIYKERVLKK